jgi:hypothetical protein
VAAVAVPGSAGEALAMAEAGLRWLAAADVASLPAAAQAGALRALERLQSVQAAARARVLAGFTARRGFEADGQGSARTWLSWQTRITPGAARAAVASMRRLEDHPAVAEALAEAAVSVSWARHITGWTDALPVENRQDADVILLAAAAGGADLAGLAGLAEEIRRRVAGPDGDGDDGFLRRGLQLDTTLGGAGRLTGNLSARCAAALQEVLDAVGARHGPEDTRTVQQRRHDALEDACTRLLAAGCLPDRAGQPARLQLHLSLDQFLHGTGRPGRPWLPPGFGGLPGPGTAGSGRGGGPGGGGAGGGEDPGPGLLPGAWAGPGDDCDAALAPVVTGRVDHHLADRLAARLAGTWAAYDPARTPCDRGGLPGCAGPHGRGQLDGRGGPGQPDDGVKEDADAGAARDRRQERSRAAARELILRNAVALLSGPGGLASWLRTGTLPPPAASISLPLDVGAVTDLVPPHLRRAIITRDRHCAAPGCDTPPPACHVHHIVPRSQGGTTSLANCILLCSFHHLIMIHRWGWTITLHADGTTTATSPHGRVLHSHSPPAAA